jgi:hypothetical protein
VSHRRGSFPLTAAPGVPSHRTCSIRAVLPVGVAIASILVAAGCGGAGYAKEPRPIGVGDRFTLTAGAVATPQLPCTRQAGSAFGVHLELFVDGWVVLVPSGIGIRQPWVGTAPYVESGACEAPIVTREPTGVIEVRGDGRTLGDLFRIWGEPLGRGGFARYRGAVTAHVDGTPWDGDPRAIPLRRHAQIVLQLGRPRIRPHQVYGFPAGL